MPGTWDVVPYSYQGQLQNVDHCWFHLHNAPGTFQSTLSWPSDIPAAFQSLAGVLVLEILGISVQVTPTVTVGNRRPEIQLWVNGVSSSVAFRTTATQIQAAGAGRRYDWQAGIAYATSLAGGVAREGLPAAPLVLYSGDWLSVSADNPSAPIDANDTVDVYIRAVGRQTAP